MILPVTHVLAFGECQRLCGLPERGHEASGDSTEMLYGCFSCRCVAGGTEQGYTK